MLWSRAWNQAFHLPLIVLATFSILLSYFASFLSGGVDLGGGADTFLLLATIVWGLSFATRVVEPGSGLAAFLESAVLLFVVGFLASLTSASMAIGAGPFVDRYLVAIDRALFPFLDLHSLTLALPGYPLLYRGLSYIYDSMVWQAFAFMLISSIRGSARDHEFLLSAWALGLLFCVLPFHWLPALSPHNYFGIDQTMMPGATVSLPWDFVPIIMELRSGSVDTLTTDYMTGMVTVPSFHACAATVLAVAWWRSPMLRWPMLALNIGMAFAAMPIGSHYGIDIVAGIAAGLLACITTRSVLRLKSASMNAIAAPAAPEPVSSAA